MVRVFVVAWTLVFLSGCGSAEDRVGSDREVRYRPVASVKQLMESVLDPAADVVWDSAGFVITAEGETDLQPTTPEGWLRVQNSAVVLAESGNLLMLPGRSAGPDWISHATALAEAGRAAVSAAEARDAEALFDAGGVVYQACRACHVQFMVSQGEVRSMP